MTSADDNAGNDVWITNEKLRELMAKLEDATRINNYDERQEHVRLLEKFTLAVHGLLPVDQESYANLHQRFVVFARLCDKPEPFVFSLCFNVIVQNYSYQVQSDQRQKQMVKKQPAASNRLFASFAAAAAKLKTRRLANYQLKVPSYAHLLTLYNIDLHSRVQLNLLAKMMTGSCSNADRQRHAPMYVECAMMLSEKFRMVDKEHPRVRPFYSLTMFCLLHGLPYIVVQLLVCYAREKLEKDRAYLEKVRSRELAPWSAKKMRSLVRDSEFEAKLPVAGEEEE